MEYFHKGQSVAHENESSVEHTSLVKYILNSEQPNLVLLQIEEQLFT